MKEKQQIPNSTLLLMIMAMAMLRVPQAAQMGPLANFSPLGAMALFGGATFSQRWKAWAFPLLTLLLSDLLINQVVYHGAFGWMHSGWYVGYSIFALIVLAGQFMITRLTPTRVMAAAITGSLLHWGISDFAVWVSGGTDLRTMQPLTRNWQGLMQCYAQGIPFFRNMLLSAITYSALAFGLYAWIQKTRIQPAGEKLRAH